MYTYLLKKAVHIPFLNKHLRELTVDKDKEALEFLYDG